MGLVLAHPEKSHHQGYHDHPAADADQSAQDTRVETDQKSNDINCAETQLSSPMDPLDPQLEISFALVIFLTPIY